MTTLRRGSTGPDVVSWQTYLRSQGYSAVNADGVFGPTTEQATIDWQRSRGLTADGIVGPASQAARASSPVPEPTRSTPSEQSSGRLSSRGRALIKSFEGLSLTAYPDAAGYSIGYGHFGAQRGQVIDRAEADRLFDVDVARFERAVAAAVPRAAQHEYDAMVSLAYNIGTDAFTRSTVVARHNRGDWQGAADAFLMWNKSQGAVLPVLERRRERERAVYLHGHDGGSSTSSSAREPSASRSALPLLLALGGGAALFFMSQRGRRSVA